MNTLKQLLAIILFITSILMQIAWFYDSALYFLLITIWFSIDGKLSK